MHLFGHCVNASRTQPSGRSDQTVRQNPITRSHRLPARAGPMRPLTNRLLYRRAGQAPPRLRRVTSSSRSVQTVRLLPTRNGFHHMHAVLRTRAPLCPRLAFSLGRRPSLWRQGGGHVASRETKGPGYEDAQPREGHVFYNRARMDLVRTSATAGGGTCREEYPCRERYDTLLAGFAPGPHPMFLLGTIGFVHFRVTADVQRERTKKWRSVPPSRRTPTLLKTTLSSPCEARSSSSLPSGEVALRACWRTPPNGAFLPAC